MKSVTLLSLVAVMAGLGCKSSSVAGAAASSSGNGTALSGAPATSVQATPLAASGDGGLLHDAGTHAAVFTDAGGLVGVPVTAIPGHETLALDSTPKQGPRLMPAEALMRTYLTLFGGLAAVDGGAAHILDLQAVLVRGGTAVFDTWQSYTAMLGLPDYTVDIPRSAQPNSLMVATFERIGVALCDKAMEHDHPAGVINAAAGSVVFDFALPATVLGGAAPPAEFVGHLDHLHQRFLSYPLSLAPSNRAANFFGVYKEVTARHAPGSPDAGRSVFTPQQLGWVSVCYGLVRHPEFHTY